MTMLLSAFGLLGRFAGDLLTSALSWASSLLFGRVPRSHQIFLVLMMSCRRCHPASTSGRAMTPATERTHRDLPRLAFFTLGAAFFGLAILDRVLALFVGFSTLLLTIFLAWLLAFLIGPVVEGLVHRLHGRPRVDGRERGNRCRSVELSSVDDNREAGGIGRTRVHPRRPPDPSVVSLRRERNPLKVFTKTRRRCPGSSDGHRSVPG